jgi:hypothetical protein
VDGSIGGPAEDHAGGAKHHHGRCLHQRRHPIRSVVSACRNRFPAMPRAVIAGAISPPELSLFPPFTQAHGTIHGHDHGRVIACPNVDGRSVSASQFRRKETATRNDWTSPPPRPHPQPSPRKEPRHPQRVDLTSPPTQLSPARKEPRDAQRVDLSIPDPGTAPGSNNRAANTAPTPPLTAIVEAAVITPEDGSAREDNPDPWVTGLPPVG